MEKYIIKQAYPWQTENVFELEITSKNLLYTEIGNTHSGAQVINAENQKLIHKKLMQIADLIRDVDSLNKITY